MTIMTSRTIAPAVPTNWRDQAACQGTNTDLFFPEGRINAHHKTAIEDAAKAVCHRCPVRRQCLEWALDTGEENGVWGGMTEKERHAELDGRSPIAGAHPADVTDAKDVARDYGQLLVAWHDQNLSFEKITHRISNRLARSERLGGPTARREVILLAYALLGVERPEEFQPRNPSPAYDTVLEKWDRVVALREKGWGRRRIAPELGVSVSTLEKADRIMLEQQREQELAA